MKLSPEEIIEIDQMALLNPLVRRLWDELNKPIVNPADRFYKSLVDATNALSEELDSIHTGTYNRYKILNGESKIYKRVFQLLTSSKKIIEGLNEGANIGKKKDGKIQKENTDKEVKEEESGVSFTDRQAELIKSKVK